MNLDIPEIREKSIIMLNLKNTNLYYKMNLF